jgi:hypothetical protein
MDVSLLTAFIGILVAMLLRTLLPYLNKMADAETKGDNSLNWNHKYTWTCITALVMSFVIAMLTLPAFNIPQTTSGQFIVFVIAFGYGWGINDATNKILIDWH